MKVPLSAKLKGGNPKAVLASHFLILVYIPIHFLKFILFVLILLLRYYLYLYCVKSIQIRSFSGSQSYDQKRKLFRTNSFVLVHSSAKKILHWTANGKVFNTVVSHDFNMTSFSPCCHNRLACICFCACICLLSRIFCLACYRLCVEQWLAFHWDIGGIV